MQSLNIFTREFIIFTPNLKNEPGILCIGMLRRNNRSVLNLKFNFLFKIYVLYFLAYKDYKTFSPLVIVIYLLKYGE